MSAEVSIHGANKGPEPLVLPDPLSYVVEENPLPTTADFEYIDKVSNILSIFDRAIRDAYNKSSHDTDINDIIAQVRSETAESVHVFYQDISERTGGNYTLDQDIRFEILKKRAIAESLVEQHTERESDSTEELSEMKRIDKDAVNMQAARMFRLKFPILYAAYSRWGIAISLQISDVNGRLVCVPDMNDYTLRVAEEDINTIASHAQRLEATTLLRAELWADFARLNPEKAHFYGHKGQFEFLGDYNNRSYRVDDRER